MITENEKLYAIYIAENGFYDELDAAKASRDEARENNPPIEASLIVSGDKITITVKDLQKIRSPIYYKGKQANAAHMLAKDIKDALISLADYNNRNLKIN
jgi:hypothetical protein